MTAAVILSTRNRAASAARTVRQLAPQLHRAGAHAIVIDNGSADDTSLVLRQLAETNPLTVVSEPQPGKNRALNRALDVANADLLVFTDDDVDFAPDWLERYLTAARAWPDHGVFGGPILPHFPCELPPHLREHEFQKIAFARFEFGTEEKPIAGVSPFGPNFAVRRRVIGTQRFDERIGPASGDRRGVPLGDETEFLRRMRARSGDLVYVPAAWVHHHVEAHQLSDSWLYDRSFRFGRGYAVLDPDRSAPRLNAVPRYLWASLIEAQAAYWRESLRRCRQARFDAGLRLHFLRGQIYQYRRGGLGKATT
jgi:glycosyltransferase involved in cell wall biosynthesis